MADTETPTLEAPAVAPAPSAPPSDSAGLDRFMSDAMEGVTDTPAQPPVKPAAPPPKTEPKPEPQPKPVAKAEPEKPPVKPAAKPVEKPKEDMNQLRTRYEGLLGEKKKWQADLEHLQKENKDLAGKRFITPDIEKEIETNKTEIARLKAQIAESAYEYSDDYKAKFVEPWQRTGANAVAIVEQLNVPIDEEGNTRKATANDFWRVHNAPVSEQADMAQKLFGTNALRVIHAIDKMNDLKQQAEVAVKSQREGLEIKTRQTQEQQREAQQKYEGFRQSARQELVQKYPQFFAEDENDPEASAAIKKGYEFADKIANGNSDMSPDERAAIVEVARAKLAWFDRGLYQINKLKSEVDSLKEELSKYRASDPGAGKEGVTETANAEDAKAKGLGPMAAEFDSL